MLIQEKGEKLFFIKAKNTLLCSVAIENLMTAVVGLSGQSLYVDEVGKTGNPATDLTQAKPADSAEHINQAKLSSQASGELPFTVLHEELDKVDQQPRLKAFKLSETKKATADYALGNYGLSPLNSINFHKARWKEMVKPYFEKNDVFTMPENENISF